MVSLFRARQYPAGREVRPSDQPLPTDTPISDTEQPQLALNDPEPTNVPPADGDPTAGGDPNSIPTMTAPSPDVPTTTDVPAQPAVIPDPPLDLSNPQLTTTDTPDQDTPPSEPITDQNQGPTNQDQQPSSDPGDGGPTPDSGSSDPGTQGDVPTSPLQSEGGYIPSKVSNDPQPTTTQTISNPPVSSTVTLSTDTLQTTPTAALTQGGALSTGSSDNKKYIIGGAVGGGVFLLILLVLLLVFCRKRRAKRDLERAGDDHREGKTDHGQFSCCEHGTCNRNNGQTPMGQRTPLRPFALKSEPVASTTKEPPRQHAVSLSRRDSPGSQKSAGSDTISYESEYSDSPQRAKKGLLKRPPPLKLTSLVTPVINGPQDNPRDKSHGSTLSDPSEIPTIVVESPRSTPRRH